MHELSFYDNGDQYILICSIHGKGFYKTDNAVEIDRYKKECTNKARSIFLTIRKARRVLKDLEV